MAREEAIILVPCEVIRRSEQDGSGTVTLAQRLPTPTPNISQRPWNQAPHLGYLAGSRCL